MQTAKGDLPVMTAETLTVGQVIETAKTCLTEDQIIDFAQKYDPQTFHVDPKGAEDTFFGRLVASGWHVLSETMRLMVEAKPLGATPLVGAELGSIRFRRPVLPNTEIMVRAEITAISSGKSPEHAYVHMVLETLNCANNDVVAKQDWKVLIPAR